MSVAVEAGSSSISMRPYCVRSSASGSAKRFARMRRGTRLRALRSSGQAFDQAREVLRAVTHQCQGGLDRIGTGKQILNDLFGSDDTSAAGKAERRPAD